MRRFIASFVLVGSVALGCSGSSSGDEGGSGYAGKRTPVCKTWQDAMCDFISDKCQAQLRPGCDELYQSLFCEADATMQTCIDALGAATCPSPFDLPAQCKSVNDPKPVADFCKDFAREVCKWGVRCGETSDQAACETQLLTVELASTCGQGVGLSSTADQCLSALGTLACGSQSPEVCKGVIKVLESNADVIVPWTTFTLAEPRLSPGAEIVPLNPQGE